MRHGLEKYISIGLRELDAIVSFLPIDKFSEILVKGADFGVGHPASPLKESSSKHGTDWDVHRFLRIGTLGTSRLSPSFFPYDCAFSITRMLEITPDDVTLLNDTDLRTLTGLLCEAELRSRGLSAATVTWSGHQNSADGGLDVRVALAEGEEISGFVPRPQTGLQVKKSGMPRTEILDEMRPEGVLRPIIRDLANRSGAYIIVSAESTSEASLRNRRQAMRDAVQELPNAGQLTLDFYDRGRIATWVRNHAGMVLWVRSKIGKSLQGWRPYEAWAYAPDGVKGEYLLDEAVRVRTDAETTESGLSSAAGIQRIRERLRRPGSIVRLVGLSGVGKTRFVQSLFDSRVGDSGLDPALAHYTDVADGPDPSPTTLVQNLIASRSRAIIVLDNCPPDLHRSLSEACRVPESTVSVITVEYDIREDQPEGTEVFELEASSEDLIEKLLKHRFPHLSWVDLHTIAQFSGGNARIAIALAETVGREETVAGISDDDLFRRLFEQRHAPNESLLVAAQGLSLVYSFQGEDVSGDHEAELSRLGAVVGKSAQDMFQGAAELRRRGLVQRRGVWRAVLPHAIANRLAARALQDIPVANIEKNLINDASERLLRSFSRRLGYLDGSPEAQKIVRGWLGADGLLADVLNLNDLGGNIFRNIAPVDPEATLSALERAVIASVSDESARRCARYVSLLVSLAYEARHFERSIGLLVRIAVAVGQNESQDVIGRDSNEASKAVASLFPIHFSGTHASAEQRESVIRSLFDCSSPAERELALKALAAALEAWHFGPFLNFGFGARSRDFGYWPGSKEAVVQWFRRFLKMAEDLACSSHIEAPRVRTVIADKFRGVWTGAAMYDDLEHMCRSISEKMFWIQGWMAVRQTIYYDSKAFTPEIIEKLTRIETILQPRGTIERVRSIILAESASYIGVPLVSDSNASIESAISRLEMTAYELGRSVAADNDALTELLPDLVRTRSDQIWSFGRGLAEGTNDPVAMWKRLVAQLRSTPAEAATPWVLRGFLNGLHQKDPVLAGTMLDDAVGNDALAQWYPTLETAMGVIDRSGFRRLIRSLELGRAPIRIYRMLQSGGVTNGLEGSDFNELLLRISHHIDGVDVAMDILWISLNRDRSSPDEVVEIGCELVRRLNVTTETNSNLSYRLEMVGKHCLIGDEGAAAVREVCSKLRDAVSRSETSAYVHRELLKILFNAQPFAVLQSLCDGDEAIVKIGVKLLEYSDLLHPHAFDVIPEGELLRWCDELPDTRYPIAASGIAAIWHDAESPHWTDIARRILEKSPDRVQVLRKFIPQFSLPGWDVSRAEEVQSNLRLLDEMVGYSDPVLEEFAAKEKARLLQAIAAVREASPPVYMDRDEGFE